MNEFFEIQNVASLKSDFDFSNKLFLVVLKPQTIPPHLILVHDNLYYDLRLQKSKTAEDFIKFKAKIFSAKIQTLFFEINVEADVVSKSELTNVFKSFNFNTEKKVTCLAPIRKSLSEILNIDLLASSNVFELLETLKINNAITNVFQFSCNEIIVEGNLKWKKYSTTQLFEGFKDLKTIENA